MNITTEQELLELTSYSVYKDKYPDIISLKLKKYLTLIHDEVAKSKNLGTASTIVASDFVINPDRPSPDTGDIISITLYVYGTFRKNFPIIEKISKILSDLYAETVIFPLIRPVITKEWDFQKREEGDLYKSIINNGIVVFSNLEEKRNEA